MGKRLWRRLCIVAAVAALFVVGSSFMAGTKERPSGQAVRSSQSASVKVNSTAPAVSISEQAAYKVPLSLATPHHISDCTYHTVPFKIAYKTVAWLPPGQTVTSGGVDGEEQVCGASTGTPVATTIIPPTSKVVTVGAAAKPGQSNSDIQTSQVLPPCQNAVADNQAACQADIRNQ